MKQYYYNEDLSFIHNDKHTELAISASLFLIDQIKDVTSKTNLIIDLGCGSGTLAKEMALKKYNVIGIDYSESMINIAKINSPDSEFIQSSFLDYELQPCFIITAIGEVFNYLFDKSNNYDSLKLLFERIYLNLEKKGIFLFDFLEPGVLGKNKTQTKIVETQMWDVFINKTENTEEETLKREITIYRKVNDLYRKSKEIHNLKLYKKLILKNILENIGFKVKILKGYNNITFEKYHIGIIATKY